MYEKLVEAREQFAAGQITLGELFTALDAFLNEVDNEVDGEVNDGEVIK